MSEKTREHISSLMDGEISRETSRFLVRRLGSDEELCATWARYHLVRDCLRHHDSGLSGDDLCDRINRALDEEAPHSASRRFSTAWLKPAAGMAIAASVALMAVLSVDPGDNGVQQVPSSLAGGEELQPFTSPQGLRSSSVTQQASLTGNGRMNSYLLRHYQAAGSAGGRGFVTYMPIVINGPAPRTETEPEKVQGEPGTQQDDQNPSQ